MRHQLVFMLDLSPRELLELIFELAYGILGDLVAVLQANALFLQCVRSSSSDTRPFEELNSLLIVLFEGDNTKPLLPQH